MKDFLNVVQSKGMIIFAGILTLLNGLSFKYIEGFSSWWLFIVIEITALASFVIVMNIKEQDKVIWGANKNE